MIIRYPAESAEGDESPAAIGKRTKGVPYWRRASALLALLRWPGWRQVPFNPSLNEYVKKVRGRVAKAIVITLGSALPPEGIH